MIPPQARNRGGFSLVELLLVMIILGILSGIAVPRLHSAIYSAHAADILADVNVVRVAYHQFLADDGVVVGTSPWGTPPAELVSYLPDGFTFETEVADYQWTRIQASASPWGVEMGLFRVRPKADVQAVLVAKLRGMAHEELSVTTATQVQFYILP